jgi:hypothetical protein
MISEPDKNKISIFTTYPISLKSKSENRNPKAESRKPNAENRIAGWRLACWLVGWPSGWLDG